MESKVIEAKAKDFGKSYSINNSSDTQVNQSIEHTEILNILLSQVKKIDFRKIAKIKNNEKLSKKHFFIICVEELIKLAIKNNWGLCKKNDIIYIYNGTYWKSINKDNFQKFLSEVALKMGVYEYDAKFYEFEEKLFKQFLSTANLSIKEIGTDEVLINLRNGTFVITPENQKLRAPQKEDFMKYILNFDYDPKAKAPKFEAFLNQVQPDNNRQKVLSEYLGYIFIKSLKLEKALILFGSGANGKSVFFDIVNALMGSENVCNYSLENLTKNDSYQRALLENKLVNYASEINSKFESSIFKKLVSGEPVEARQIYSSPFIMTNYAKLIFNCNELPKEVEHTNAYYRRFLIVHFNISIPEKEQNKELAKEIISTELAGVFNWVLDGLKRLLREKNFTECEAIKNQLAEYKMNSDSVLMFIDDENYRKSVDSYKSLKDLYESYRYYCKESGFISCAINRFSERLTNNGFRLLKRNIGKIVYVEKYNIDEFPC